MNTNISNSLNINNNVPFQSTAYDIKNNLDMELETCVNSNTNTNTNIDCDDTDSDEYVDLSSSVESNSENIYQFSLNNEHLMLKHIGKCNVAPDIIIMENFGPNSNLNLYNCVYASSELDTLIKSIDVNTNENQRETNELFFPLVKLIKSHNEQFDIACVAVKLLSGIDGFVRTDNSNLIQTDVNLNNWELCFVEYKHDDLDVKIIYLDKNINPSNMIEKIIELSVDF